MNKDLKSKAPLLMGIISWIVYLIVNNVIEIYTIHIFYPIAIVLTSYNFISGIINLIMLFLAVKFYIKDKNIKLLLLSIIINVSYLINYFMMFQTIIRN